MNGSTFLASPDSTAPPGTTHTAARLFARLFEALVVLTWALFVLRYQYHAASLASYDLTLDALFLFAVAGTATARGIERRGLRAVGATLVRLALAAFVTAVALVAAEYL